MKCAIHYKGRTYTRHKSDCNNKNEGDITSVESKILTLQFETNQKKNPKFKSRNRKKFERDPLTAARLTLGSFRAQIPNLNGGFSGFLPDFRYPRSSCDGQDEVLAISRLFEPVFLYSFGR